MSQSVPPIQPPAQPPTPSAAAQPAPPPAPVRLPTWVNVVLILILLASCGGASSSTTTFNGVDEGSIANQVVMQLQQQDGWGTPAGPASQTEVEDLCRLLGAVAAKEKVPLTVMSADEMTRCHEVAQEAATATK